MNEVFLKTIEKKMDVGQGGKLKTAIFTLQNNWEEAIGRLGGGHVFVCSL